jgi:hypothetical protein
LISKSFSNKKAAILYLCMCISLSASQVGKPSLPVLIITFKQTNFYSEKNLGGRKLRTVRGGISAEKKSYIQYK